MLSWIMEFFWDDCFCLFFVGFAVVASSLWISFLAKILPLAVKSSRFDSRYWTDYKHNNFDDCILLTRIARPINFYRAVVNSTLKKFSEWSWLRLEMRLCKLFSVNHTKLNINETNTYSKVNYKNTSETSNFVAL